MSDEEQNILTSDLDESADRLEDIQLKKTIWERYFSPMKEGSLRGSVFAISAVAIGTGCFSLPIRCAHIGLIFGVCILLFGAFCAYWSLTSMIHAARKSKEKDYSRIVKESLGKVPATILDSIMVIYIFGVLISYQVVIYSLIGRVFYELFQSNKYKDFEEYEKKIWNTNSYKFPVMFGVSLILLPLCLLKDLSKMRFTSMIGIMALSYAILVIIIESPFFFIHYLNNVYKKDDSSTHANFYNIKPAFKNDLYVFQCFATVFYCFTCHIGAFPVYKTLKNNTVRRINKVFRNSIILDLVIYSLVAIAGFLTCPVNQPSLIIYRENHGVLSTDIFMTIAKMGIAISLTMSIPPNYNSFRISFIEVVFKTNEISQKLNYGVTIPVVLLSTFIGVIYNDILKYISLLGGFLSVVIAFLMPTMIYVKNNDYEITNWRNICSLIFVTFLCTVGFIAGIGTILF